MRSWFTAVLAVLLCIGIGTPARAATTLKALKQPGLLWRAGDDSVRVVSCAGWPEPGPDCLAIEARRGAQGRRLGGGFIAVRRLWSRPPGAAGPDVLVIGDSGGSGGDSQLFAVSFSPGFQVRKLTGESFSDMVKVTSARAPLRFEAPFVLGFFNGAPHAGSIAIPLPMRWAHGDFAVDLPALGARRFPPGDLAFRTLAARNELNAWANTAYPATRLFPPQARDGTPTTAYAVLEPLLAGHAGAARAILHAAWPRQSIDTRLPMGGEGAFWQALCQSVVRSAQWRLGLSHLPEANVIAAGAVAMKQ